MKDQLITFETAKLAKEKGFNEPCYDAYNDHGMQYSNGWLEYIDDAGSDLPFDDYCLKHQDVLSPTQSLLQKWLREKHSIHLEIIVQLGFEHWNVHLLPSGKWVKPPTPTGFNSYEEALEKGLQQALKLIK